MSDTLYDEAIADAKKLREVAEQNAKNAIIEAVTPKIREFIEEQLVNESSENNDGDFKISKGALDEDEDVLNSLVTDMLSNLPENDNTDLNETEFVLDDTALSTLMELLSDSENNDSASDLAKRISETFEQLSDTDSKKILSAVQKLTNNNNLSSSVINNNMLVTEESRDMSQQNSDEVYYDVDLDSLLEAVGEGAAADDDDKDEDREVLEDLEEMQYDEDAHDAELQEILASLTADADINEAVLEIDVGDVEISDEFRDAISRATLSVADKEEDEEADDLELEDPAEDDVDLDADLDADLPLPDTEPVADSEDLEEEAFEIDEQLLRSELSKLRMMAEKNQPSSNTLTTKNLDKKLRNERRKNRSLNHKLAEYRSAVETLRGQLSEMNLFNAKLLYVNKLLQQKGVSDEQRKTVIESLDKARNLREVKLLYKSLSESMGKRSGNLSESAVRRSVGSSSRATRSASPDSAPREVDRWAKLAGIK
tara:strand:+ start:45534 stop:46985 length:1452 start_codon:yes stop_codon:yes gene_type:complete